MTLEQFTVIVVFSMQSLVKSEQKFFVFFFFFFLLFSGKFIKAFRKTFELFGL